MKYRIFILLFLSVLALNPAPVVAENKEIYLSGLLEAAFESNPDIRAAIASIRSAKGGLTQAGLRPNPEATIELENFSGGGTFSGTQSAETTYGLVQEIEVGGKRYHRKRVARYDLQIARQEAASSILAILADIHQSYVELLVARERVILAEKRVELANSTHEAVKRRVSAAAASDIQHTKVDIEQQAAEIEKAASVEALTSAEARIEMLVPGSLERLDGAGIRDLEVVDLPLKNRLLEWLENSPQAVISNLRKLQSKNRISLAKANGIPNPKLGLGFRRFNETNNNALIASFSIPLPLFNRNQGNIARERAESFKAENIANSNYLSLKQNAESVYAQMLMASRAVKSYEDQIVPSALRAYKQASEGYNLGRFSFLELLDAQRTLYEMQGAMLSSLLKLHNAKAQIDFLMGAHINLIQNNNPIIKGE